MRRPAVPRLRLPVALRALALPNYRRWALADLVSNTGSWMSTAALGWLVFDVTGSAAALGAVVAVKQVPSIAFGLLGGALADRLDARRVLPWTQGTHAVLAALLAVLVHGGDAHLWHLYAFAALTGTIGVLDGPSFGRLLGQVLGREHLSNGIALGSITHSTGWVLGLAAGSVVLAGPGASAVFAIDAVSFAFVALTVVRLRPDLLHPLDRAVRGADRVRDGVRYVLGSRQLVVVLGAGVVTGAVGRHFQVTMAAMADGVFDGGPGLYGRLFTCFSVGALLGAAVAARLRAMRLPVLLGSAGAAAVVQATAGAAPAVWVFAGAMVAVAACSIVYDTAVSTTVQLLAPGHLRGRVLAVQGLVSSLASIAGAPLVGLLTDVLGPRAALGIGGGLSLLAVLVAACVLAGGPAAVARSVRTEVVGRRVVVPSPAPAPVAA
ncbi:MFS transporter [Cellulomonas fimi]|uniref:MFS transporter n=1 Tax=Cellulomonas fimi TaxID=1708 RepID=UPI00234D9F68|nr:MFS transporter [Cellulomonas fimi]MDC7120435.1 MFS transporter [Cellulomonas fimi]